MTAHNTRLVLVLVTFATAQAQHSAGQEKTELWKLRNAAVVRQFNLTTRERRVPDTKVRLKQQPGLVYVSSDLPEISLAEGVTARIAWGKGALLEQIKLAPNAKYVDQPVLGEAITVVERGSVTFAGDNGRLTLHADEFIYLTAGMRRALQAGPSGATLLEIFSPVRRDHLAAAGVQLASDADVSFPDQGVKRASVKAGVVNHLKRVQWTAITAPDRSKTWRRSSAHARLIWGRNMMLSFVRMDPLGAFPLHIHPEDQLMIALRGALVEGIMDLQYAMSGKRRDVVLQPGGMAHSAKLSEYGADALDVFWPVRPDYIERAKAQSALYEQVIAPGTVPVKLAEGFTFAEGPTWLKGALYFSDMHFRDHRNGDWTGAPAKSRLIRMQPDGEWAVLSQGMQTNGTIASPTGNLLVCDMFGHRVVEIDRTSGKILRTVLDRVNGRSVDGPNDMVMDAAGGIYVSDPQFTPEQEKNQPGTQVYYVAADGSAKVVIPAGQFAMPNGVEISPDGKTFYVNNTWRKPGENYIWAYDVGPDGSLSNRRRFAMLHLTGDVLNAVEPNARYDSRADGMAVDEDGRIYVCTLSGVQIFDQAGVYLGTIWCPQYPVSCTFFRNTLYMVGESSVWSIETRVKGFRLPHGLN
ncbi:MAG: SMP-30/gluconolactonase/LRE family protein [Planctomycetota bacterium]|nr:SMP-30/gluconolactonase/LRE family protein [Planctomycetota bacterium]